MEAEESPGEDGKRTTGIVVGVVIGMVIAGAITVGVVWLVWG